MSNDRELRDAISALTAAHDEIDRLAERDGLRGPLGADGPVPVASHDYLVAVERLAERAEHYQRVRERS